jgi:hypothetical protein
MFNYQVIVGYILIQKNNTVTTDVPEPIPILLSRSRESSHHETLYWSIKNEKHDLW